MRNTETQSGKGFKLQTLRAIEVFFDAIIKNGINTKIFIATEKIGDIYIKTNDKIGVEEVKNYSKPHSINSDEIKNTLINFIDIFIKYKSQKISLSFYSTAKRTEADNNKLEHSILYYLEKKVFTTDIINVIKNTIIPYYKDKNSKGISNIEEINKFTENDWELFLSNIIWRFNLPGNQDISDILKQKCKDVIEEINPNFLTFNGFETSTIYEFRDQLEKILEENKYLGDFGFKDFELIVYKEFEKRNNIDKERNYGKFKKISDCSFPIQTNYFFFTNYEISLIEKLTNQLSQPENRNFILLTGKSAQGKTVLSRQIGYNLENKGFLFLYIDLNHRVRFSELNLEGISNENSNVFCLLTKSHLNLELINDIITYQERYTNINFIFESRIIDRTFEEEADKLFDNEQILEERLDFKKDKDFKEKYTGIVNKFTTTKIDIDLLIKATGRNFLYLSEYLQKVNISDLNAERYNGISDLVLNKYIGKKYDGFKEFAIINQYEIPIKFEHSFEKYSFSELVKKNELISLYNQTDYYNLYHPDFAKLIANSIYKSKQFNNLQIIEFETRIFEKYLLETNYCEMPTVIKSLYINSNYSLLKSLLTRTTQKSSILNYYSNPDNFVLNANRSKSLRDLIKIIIEVCPKDIPEYLKVLIVDNKRLKEYFIDDSSFIFSLIKFSSYIKQYQPDSFKDFNDKLPIFFSNNTINIPFSAIAFYLNETNKKNSTLFGLLRNNYSFDHLKAIAKDEDFLSITEGILLLQKIENEDAFIDEMREILISNSTKTSIDRFSKGLQNICQVAPIQFSIEIFNKYPENLLIEELQRLEIRMALKTVNILKKYGYEKVYRNFKLLKFNNGFKQYNYIEIYSILLEVNKFLNNHKLSTELITSIDIDLLLDKIQKGNPYYVAQSFHILFKQKGYREYIERLLYQIPKTYFTFQKNDYNIFKLVEILHWLKLVEKKGVYASECLVLNYDIIVNSDFENMPFDRIILIFTYIKGINKIKAQELVIKNKAIIRNKINSNNYKTIGISLSQLSKISNHLSDELISDLLNDKGFIYFLNSEKINIISRTLNELHIVTSSNNITLINNLYLSLKNEVIKESIENLKFDVICNSLNELLSVETTENKRTRKLVWDIGFEDFRTSILISSFIGISIGFISLNKINRKFTSDFFSYSYDEILKIASSSELKELSDALKAFSSFNPAFASEIYNSSNIPLNTLAKETDNYSLSEIKRCLYYLKSIDKPKTKELLNEFNTDSLLYKFKIEKQFDKATELLSQLYLLGKTKIEKVVNLLGSDEIYDKCNKLELKVISKGLSELVKINKQISLDVLIRINNERNIPKEISLLQFDVFGKTIREIYKIERKISKDILLFAGHYLIAKKATNMSVKQLNLGFGTLKQVDIIFAIEVAKKLLQLKPQLKPIFRKNKSLNELINNGV